MKAYYTKMREAAGTRNRQWFIQTAAFLLIPLAGLTSHTWLPFPPNLLLFFLSLLCIFPVFDSAFAENPLRNQNATTVLRDLRLVFLFSFSLFFSQYYIDAPFRSMIGVVVAPLFFAVSVLVLSQLPFETVQKLGRKFIFYSVIILIAECILRYSYSIYTVYNGTNYYLGFYRVKFCSPMYVTSNAVALQIVALYFFILWWISNNKNEGRNTFLTKKDYFWARIILIGLLILTFSRAAWIAFVIGLLYKHFFYQKSFRWLRFARHDETRNLKLIFLAIAAILCIIGLVFMYQKIRFDDSFVSKFFILNQTISFYKQANWTSVLFGVGFLKSTEFLGIYAHNYFLIFLMEGGLIGFILLCALLVFFLKKTKGQAWIIFIPFFLQAMSEAVTYMPYLFVSVAFMYIYTNFSSTKTSL